MTGVCSIEGCDKPTRARGLCSAHSPEAFCTPRMSNDEERARMFYADEALVSILSEREGQE